MTALIEDPRMEDLLLPSSRLERIWSGAKWAEGAVYLRNEDALVWSDIPNNRMLRWTESEGSTVFREGRRFNSPNDLVVKSDGTIWFTDPDYGILSDYEGYMAPSEIGSNNVYRFDPATGHIEIVASDFEKPNGLAFSPCETRLYISDSSRSHDPKGRHHIRVFDVENGRRLRSGSVFAEIEPGMPDGLRVDRRGHVFTSAGDGIAVYSPAGKRLGKIPVPEPAANCCFGGPGGNTLFIAATTSIYRIQLNIAGAPNRA